MARSQSTPDFERTWDAYAKRFISGDGRVIDPQGGDRTTSEGQSYALFFSLVSNDRVRFDKLLTWTESNLGQGDLGREMGGGTEAVDAQAPSDRQVGAAQGDGW